VSDIEITIKLPEELVERAKAVGIQIEEQTEQIAAVLETQIRRREAAYRLTKIAEELQSLPPELKPTPEEIEAEIRAYWAEKSAPEKSADNP
jgi:hypothetical protein